MKLSKTESKDTTESILSDSESISISNKSDNSSKRSKSEEQIEDRNNKRVQFQSTPQNKVMYTPILTYIKNSSSETYSEPDITKKIMIIYGIAASLYKIHGNDLTKVNVTPNYIFLDENLNPYIDLQKLNSDSKKQNADDFLIFNKDYSAYYPPEAKNSENSISENGDIRKKIDSYIYGSLVLSFMTKTVFDKNTDLLQILDDSDLPENIRNSIESCLNEDQMYRPLFSDILYVIDSSDFLNDLTDFDEEKFKKYQQTVVSEDFIRRSVDSDLELLSKNSKIKIYSSNMFTKGKRVGQGMSCQVLKKSLKEDNSVVVAYKMIKDLIKEENKKRLIREVEILANVDHYAVQKLFGYIPGNVSKGIPPVILTLFENNGSLQDVIDNKLPNFDFTQKYIAMYGIVAGMYYLHKQGIAHRDLKPPNILMNDNLEPLICDFGLSKKVESNETHQSRTSNRKDNLDGQQNKKTDIFLVSFQFVGTPLYMPPEQLRAPMNSFFAIYDAKLADVFSFAMIVYVLFTGRQPWKDSFDARENVIVGRRPEIPDDFPKTIKLLIQACWVDEPKMRPTFEIILNMISHPIFIKNLGEEFDMDRFTEYQKKVVDESFFNKNTLETHKFISFNDIAFPEFPKEKIFSKDDFEEVSPIEKQKNPFFDIQQVKKDSLLFNRIDIKNEYFSDDEVISRLKTQVKVLLSIDHPAFNPLYGVISTPPKCQYFEDAKDIYDIFPQNDLEPPSLITPFLSKGSLVNNQSNLNITQKFIILYGVAAGMYYLHKQGMAHLNLKSENVLLNDDLEPIINIDIISRPKHERENLLNFLPLFSFSYVAPELFNFQKGHYTTFNEKQADVYSFAMVAYYLLSGIHPWDSSRGFQPILRKSIRNEKPVTDHIIPAPFNKLIEDCWETDPIKRPSFKEILNRIGSESFIRSIELLDLNQFQSYQKKVVPDSFIFPIHICSIRKRDEFEFKELIGQGSFGQVNLYIDKTNNTEVAFKEIPEEHSDFVEKQIKILPVMNFPSIVSLYGFIEPEGDKKESVILTPYIKKKNLETLLKNESKESNKLEYTQKCIIMYGIAFGMYELHLHNIAHQNLKPQNILINESLEPLITDFAISKFVNSNQSIYQTMSIDPAYYISPEAYYSKKNSNGNDYDEKLSDVYSFGLLVYYLMTGIKPFEATNNLEDLMIIIKNGERPKIPDIIPSKMKKLITKCWDSDPSSRPSFYEILSTISEPDFYKLKGANFESQKFYNYQVKLGELQFIKFDDEKIQRFQLGASCSLLDLASSAHLLSSEILLKEMAEKYNNPELQYRLACFYRDGKRIDKDLNKAAEYFEKAANQNHLNAKISLAICYKKGYGVPVNINKANKLIQKAIDGGSIDALVIRAKWYLKCFPRKYQEAMKLLQKADENDHPDAPAIIGSLIEKKRVNFVSKTEKDVIELYKKSCYLGSYEGMYNMATHYHYGINVEKDKNEAIRLYNLTLKNQNFNRNKTSAVFSLSQLYEENKEYVNAFNLADHYRLKDKFVGYLLCSDFHKRGIGCEVNNELSKKYYEIACQKRFINEQLKFAGLYHHGKGIKKNEDEFLKWTKIAAENGSSIAQANLCRFYLNKKHRNHQLAEKFGKQSAESGNHFGYWNLSRLYKQLHKDKQEILYLQKSAESGSDKALVYMGMNFKRNKKNSEAFEKFKEASERNNPSGIYHYGNEMLLGEITSKNIQEGLKKIKEAADAGHRKAIKKLIEIYSKGLEGIAKDLKMSEEYEVKLTQLPRHSKL